MATADGGVIATADYVSATTFDQNGNATGQIANMPTQSWTMNEYQQGSTAAQVVFTPAAAAFSFAAFLGGNPSGFGTSVRPHSTPQEGLYALSTANLTARSQCDALLAQFASMARIPEATLIAQIQATANVARDYVYDGPSSNTSLDPVKFPGAASPGVTTVGEWFTAHSQAPFYAEGFSQVNGYAVWFRLDDWHSWYKGFFSQYLINTTGKINYYGMGTVMHETLHKLAVGGGFTHDDMDAAIGAVGWPPLTGGHNPDSDAIGTLCFGNLQ
jgi:hypothetical protein